MNPQKYSVAHDLSTGEPAKFLFNFTFFQRNQLFMISHEIQLFMCVGITFLS